MTRAASRKVHLLNPVNDEIHVAGPLGGGPLPLGELRRHKHRAARDAGFFFQIARIAKHLLDCPGRTGADFELYDNEMAVAVLRRDVDLAAGDGAFAPIICCNKTGLHLVELPPQQTLQFPFIAENARARLDSLGQRLLVHIPIRLEPNVAFIQ